VPQDARRITLDWIAPPSTTRQLVTIDVATSDRHRDLRRHDAVVSVRIDDVHRGLSGAPAVEAEWMKGASVGADLQYRFLLAEAVIAAEAHAAAEFPGAARIGNELEGEDLEGVLDLDDLGRVGRQVRKHTSVAVEAVGPGPAAPGRADEVDV